MQNPKETKQYWKSMYERVKCFNETLGVLERDQSSTKGEIEENALRLVWEELTETLIGQKNGDKVEELDGYVDSLVVILGLAIRQKISFEALLNYYNMIEEDCIFKDLFRVYFALEEVADNPDTISEYMQIIIILCESKGYPWQKAFDRIHENNMTKFCKTKEEAEESAALCPDLVYEQRGEYFVIYNSVTKKIYKPIGYKPVVLTDLFD